VPVPSTTPDHRGQLDVAPPESYHSGQPVWVYRGSWRPGVVLTASAQAVTVRYRPYAGRATGVDTVFRLDLQARDEPDRVLDNESGDDTARREAR
jgi:hypothetical protein